MWDARVQNIAGWVQAQAGWTRQVQGHAAWQVHGGERSHATGAAKGIANKNTKRPLKHTHTRLRKLDSCMLKRSLCVNMILGSMSRASQLCTLSLL